MEIYNVSIDNYNDIVIKPATIGEIDLLFETKIDNIQVGKTNIILAVDKGNTSRGEDKGAGYFKYYPNCTSIAKDMNNQKVYRISPDKAEYTAHDGVGITPDYRPMSERKMLIAALATEVSVNGQRMSIYDALCANIKSEIKDTKIEVLPITNDTQNKKKGKNSSKIIRVDTKHLDTISDSRITKYLDIKYDGKRKL